MDYASVSVAFYRPVSLFAVFPDWFLGENYFRIYLLWLFSLVLAATPWRPKLTSAAVFALSYLVFGYPKCFGKANHLHILLFIASFLFFLGEVFTHYQFAVPERFRRLQAFLTDRHWALTAIQAVTAFTYFAAGLQKLHTTGWSWLASTNMQNQLLLEGTPFGKSVAEYPFLCGSIAAGILLLELASPLSLLLARTRAWWIFPIGWFVFNISTQFSIIGATFVPQVAVYLSFVPWHRFRHRTAAISAPGIFQASSLPNILMAILVCGFAIEFFQKTLGWPFAAYDMFASEISTRAPFESLHLELETDRGEKMEAIDRWTSPFSRGRLLRSLNKTLQEGDSERRDHQFRELSARIQKNLKLNEQAFNVLKLSLIKKMWREGSAYDPENPDQIQIIFECEVKESAPLPRTY